MIKKMKLIIALTLMGNIVNAGITNAYAVTTTFTQANQIAEQCYRGYNKGAHGPICITQGELINNSGKKDVYLIALSGTELVKQQSTGLLTDLKSGFEKNSPYLDSVVINVQSYIPRNSNLIIAGHSLGGMIAQQASGNSGIKDNYNVLNVVTFGAPLINPIGREGVVKRLGDKADKVPYLSAMGTMLLPWQVTGLNVEDGGYGSNFIEAHRSYKRADEWGEYDVVGIKNGSNKLVCNPDTSKFFFAPTK